jgi:polar amino acid transport system substrate-binding protein
MSHSLPLAVRLAAGALLLASAAVQAERLQITTEMSYPATYMENGRIVGYGTDKVREILRRTGIEATIDMQPWKRAYTQALNQADTCVYSTTRTPEREALFKWIGPLVETDWVMYARADRHYQFKALEDTRHLSIGAYIGDVRGEFLEARGYKIAYVAHDESNPMKIMAGRIDLWATSTRFATLRLNQSGLAGKIVPVLVFNHAQLYLACNLAVSDSLMARMNAALAAMQADGTVKAIDQRYAAREQRDRAEPAR